MSPKRPIKPGAPTATPDTPFAIPDASPPFLHRLPLNIPPHGTDSTPIAQPRTPGQSSPDHPAPLEIIELPADTHITPVIAHAPIEHFFLPPSQLSRLPPPDALSGFRKLGTQRHFVDLQEGGTVLLGIDPENHYRAKLHSDFRPSGPRVERVEGTLFWRVKPTDESPGGSDSRLTIKRVREAHDDSAEVIDPKRTSTSTSSDGTDPWKQWQASPQQPSLETIEIDGTRFLLLPRGTEPDHPIVYIKNPEHRVYDFDYMERILDTDLMQQPRGAIRIPPANQWEVDPNPPFQHPLKQYITTYFPQMSKTSTNKVARHQFFLANDGEMATGVGLTRLRQTFNDWKSGNSAPRPTLADPLLMLPILPTSSTIAGLVRTLDLPDTSPEGPLQRLDFDQTSREWDYFKTTQSGFDLKWLMAEILNRQGYDVFPPAPSTAFPALVFRRKNHSFVFFISLHRVRGRTIHQRLYSGPDADDARLNTQVGYSALQEILQAHAEKRLVCLKGGSQILASQPDSIFIVREDESQLGTLASL
ncbi:hypothetical protein [Pseudomonas sp.]|jgi:hypothetical protein|uniref:hypothetical protein n=1 Tax=Pseudomonas sp. TaxID=306 RepID=UPI002E35C196|nr:hypothetical protein [Pseudomonas sp.]HEX4546932.1 hypothetical protein [Pseudomonas sp.]